MTLKLETDWRTKSGCDADSPDTFQTVEDLVEDGLAKPEAQDRVAMAERAMKALCKGCPVRSKCKDEAMRNDEEFGVWGMLNASERLALRPTWLKIKQIQGVAVAPAVVKDQDALHANPGVDFRYQARQRQVHEVRDRLMTNPGFVLKTKYVGTHSYEEFMQLLDVVLAHPQSSAEELAGRIGKSRTWFNAMLQGVCEAMGVEAEDNRRGPVLV